MVSLSGSAKGRKPTGLNLLSTWTRTGEFSRLVLLVLAEMTFLTLAMQNLPKDIDVHSSQ